VIADDDFGVPAATITSFGGGSLGGSVTSHAPGTSAALPGGGTVRLDADGSLSVDTNGNTGELTFQYRLTNAAGTSDATVIVTAEDAPAEDSPPSVMSTTPGDGATGVAPTGPITVRFTEAVTIESGTFELECPAGPANARAFTLSGSGNADIVLTPMQPMPLGTTCRVIVNAAGVRDVDQFDPPNRPEEDYDFRFTIGTPPLPVGDSYFTALNTLLSVPAAGVLSGDALGTPAANVTSFGSGSLGGSVTSYSAGAAVPFGGTGLAQLNANGSLSLTPPAGFVGTISFQYRLSNAAGSGDATVTVRVDAPPAVLTTTPGDGATGVPVATDLTVTFSEAVTLGASWIQANCTTSGALTAADFAVTGGPAAFALNPATDFAAGETCTFTVASAQVTDTDSDDPPDQMAGNHVFSFSTQLPPSAVADSYSTVTNTVLNQGAPGVLSNDVTGVPSGAVVSFGGGSLGGSVTTHTAGATAAFGGTGSVTVNADGSFSVTPPDGFSGDVTFLYRLSNASGSSDAQVTVQVQDAAPAILSTSPVNGATNVPANANLTATFTEPVFVAVPPTFQCTVSGTLTIADFIPSGGPTGFTLDPIVDFAPGETCTGVILAGVVTDLDTDDPPDNMTADFVFSFTVDAAPAVDAAFELESSFAGTDARNFRSAPPGRGAAPRSPLSDGLQMSAHIPLTARASVPEHVLVQEIEGQSAILHLEANEYFGLDDVGTDIWRAATNGATVGEAIDYLSAVYEVEYEKLKDDVLALLDRLRELGLVEMQ
jgi:hypothetical protein